MEQSLSADNSVRPIPVIRFRISNRLLLVLVLVVCGICMVVVLVQRRQDRRQALQRKYHNDGADILLAVWSDDINELTTWKPREFGIDRIINFKSKGLPGDRIPWPFGKREKF